MIDNLRISRNLSGNIWKNSNDEIIESFQEIIALVHFIAHADRIFPCTCTLTTYVSSLQRMRATLYCANRLHFKACKYLLTAPESLFCTQIKSTWTPNPKNSIAEHTHWPHLKLCSVQRQEHNTATHTNLDHHRTCIWHRTKTAFANTSKASKQNFRIQRYLDILAYIMNGSFLHNSESCTSWRFLHT